MPGRCLTGSSPLRTRIDPSEYSDCLLAMGRDCRQGGETALDKCTVGICQTVENALAFQNRYICLDEYLSQNAPHVASADLRRCHRFAGHGYSARFRFVAAADDTRNGLGARGLCHRHRHSKYLLGFIWHFFRHVGRPLRCLSRHGGQRPAVRSRFMGHGPRHFTRLVGSEEHTSELQSHHDLVCRLLLAQKKNQNTYHSKHYVNAHYSFKYLFATHTNYHYPIFQ